MKLFSLFIIILLIAGCGGTHINLDGWEPKSYVQGTPIYTNISENEICIITSVLQSFKDRYKTHEGIGGIWIIRDYYQKIPCIDGPNGTACKWSEVNAVFGYADSGNRGMGGLAYDYQYVLISMYEGHIPSFAANTMHEFGHAILKLHHDTLKEKFKWSLWENDMWFNWTLPQLNVCNVS